MKTPIVEKPVTMLKKFTYLFTQKALIAGAVVLAISSAEAAMNIDGVNFAQTHVHKATDPYFSFVGDRDVLIKAHVVDPAGPAAPAGAQSELPGIGHGCHRRKTIAHPLQVEEGLRGPAWW